MADPMFTGDLGFLSNFDTTPFYCSLLDEDVKSAEHAFNALKTRSREQIQWVLDAATPKEAKSRGRQVSLHPEWDTGMRFMTMQNLLLDKFHVPRLKQRLKDTGSLYLRESNFWHDNYWGTCYCSSCREIDGQNILGEILMGIRIL